MNRTEEYWALVAQLRETPPELAGTVDRARARARRKRRGKRLGIPLASLGGVAAAFVVLVNCSTPFAMACRRVPFVRELAQAVAFQPSLKAAFENDYVQPVGQSQTQNGITATVEYLIVDQTSLNVFYTLSWAGETWLDVVPDLLDENGASPEGSRGASWGDPAGTEEDYRLMTFYFDGGALPEKLQLVLKVSDSGRDKVTGRLAAPADAPAASSPWPDEESSAPSPVLAEFTFPLTIDPSLLGPGRTVEVGQWVELDGQRLYLDQLTIDPTRMELTLEADPDNTAELRSLDCYALDGAGNRYDSPSITFGGGEAIQLESCYFSENQDLTLYIEEAQWLDKDRTSFTLDLTTGEADWLPENLTDVTIERRDGNVYLSFRNDEQIVTFDGYCDPEGGQHTWGSMSMSSIDKDGDGYSETMTEYRVLRDYPWDTVTIGLSSNRAAAFDPPIQVNLPF
ncbi:MAG TPA: DUF4179 domain-containing protein [Candidatus Intestinimonas pullistercoris]|uniref:DUF4179 domain-containing protein n=1 Tax=Candidatus Intestinimonas pullistercoris TaxID=2838623 RepID=A0A9D2P121_9FIRM|nr:DUF4179 domain-containing protein [uncultured Intestinimonas sp.]HJC41291.1 DUF4179 domain-containing protein [Candidatus Intestinimonas pullistercoris]